ncbi:ABC transporter permease [Stagnihabitans tardus]|uniref:FtsX-like permease family protein n=1 Tax=Stagnihabitans tardus TaxID=2699202 RepID=A0AAE4YD85_9RHOB|nr:ABC transporter permease [Stagnihabitans tardus]NBZ87420.1 FtsX-like permease family protein [Stagnihabitans tardus]
MLIETFRLALLTVARNKLRSFLTVLGIVIGVSSVIAMVTVGQGSTQRVQSDVASLGSNLLMVRPGQPGRGPGGGQNDAPPLKAADVEALLTEIPDLVAATPAATRTLNAVYGDVTHAVTVTGTDNAYFPVRGWTLSEGRVFTEQELRAGTPVCVIGTSTSMALIGQGNPVGITMRIGKITCEVVGLLTKRDASTFGSDDNDTVIMPLKAFQRRIAGNSNVSSISVTFSDAVTAEEVTPKIQALMRERRGLTDDQDDNFNVFDMKQISSMLTGITGTLTGLLSAVAAISLLVGGIGIMNIMLVSVTERTREIGIRMAIGATEGQVLMQFLVEAVVLSLIGGFIGVIVGLGLGWAGSSALNIAFVPDWRITGAAFVFSAVVGVVFGYFPARRAARLDPIEALRHQ